MHKVAHVAANRPEPLALVAPPSDVRDRILFDVQALQSGQGFLKRSDFRVAGLQITGHDLHGPAVAPEPVNNCADATEPLVQVGGIAPEASAGQAVFIKLNYRLSVHVPSRIDKDSVCSHDG